MLRDKLKDGESVPKQDALAISRCTQTSLHSTPNDNSGNYVLIQGFQDFGGSIASDPIGEIRINTRNAIGTLDALGKVLLMKHPKETKEILEDLLKSA